MGTIDPLGYYHQAPDEKQITPDQEIDWQSLITPGGQTDVPLKMA